MNMSKPNVGLVTCASILVVVAVFLVTKARLAKSTLQQELSKKPGNVLPFVTRNAGAGTDDSTAVAKLDPPVARSKTDLRRNDRVADIQKRHAFKASLVDRTYGPVLEIFNLSPAQVLRLKELLTERNEALADARDLVDQNRGSRKELESAFQAIYDQSDKELVAFLGTDKFSTLKNLMGMVGTLGRVTGTDAKNLAVKGYPLNASQMVQTASVLNETFNGTFNPLATQRDALPIDPKSGTNELDDQALQKLSGFLRPEQVSYFQESFSVTNKVVAANTRPKGAEKN